MTADNYGERSKPLSKYQFAIHVQLEDSRLCNGCPFWGYNWGGLCKGDFGSPVFDPELKSYVRTNACIEAHGPWGRCNREEP